MTPITNIALATLLVLAPASANAASLTGVCPNPVIFQTDWFPQAENALAFNLIGEKGTVDPNKGTYSGPLGDTGLTLEVRLGGPFVGYQSVTALMYQDPAILLGLVSTDESILNAAKFPTVGIMAPLQKSPQVIMFAKADFPSLSSWTQVKGTKAKILYFEGSSFMTYLLAKGLVDSAQIDGSYDGSPSRFATEDKIMQSGYVTNDVYRYTPVMSKPEIGLVVSRESCR